MEIRHINKGWNQKICDVLFFSISFSFCFNEIPERLQIPSIGGPIGVNLVVYPLIISVVYSLYKFYKNRMLLIDFKYFKWYMVVFIGISLVSLINGLMQYPYFPMIAAGPEIKSHFLPYLFKIFEIFHLPYSNVEGIALLIALRNIKLIFLYAIYTFFCSYMLFCWYYNNWERAVRVLILGCTSSLLLVIIIGLMNMLSLSGNVEVKEFLTQWFYPYILREGRVFLPDGTIALRTNQIQSIFPEPSYIGNYCSIILPLLFFSFFYSKKYILIILGVFLFSLMVFLSQSRTAIYMLIIIMLLYFVAASFFHYPHWKIKLPIILLVISTSFIISLVFINQYLSIEGNHINKESGIAEQYIKKNIQSVDITTDNRKGNAPRKTYIFIHLREGLDYPLLGIGSGLTDAYDLDYVTPEEKKNPEVRNFIKAMKYKGIIQSEQSLVAQNEFAQRFSENGIIGLCIFIFPFGFILYKVFFLMLALRKEKKDIIILVWIFVSIVSGLISGFNGNLTNMYNIWPILGIAYIVYSSYNRKKE